MHVQYNIKNIKSNEKRHRLSLIPICHLLAGTTWGTFFLRFFFASNLRSSSLQIFVWLPVQQSVTRWREPLLSSFPGSEVFLESNAHEPLGWCALDECSRETEPFPPNFTVLQLMWHILRFDWLNPLVFPSRKQLPVQ